MSRVNTGRGRGGPGGAITTMGCGGWWCGGRVRWRRDDGGEMEMEKNKK